VQVMPCLKLYVTSDAPPCVPHAENDVLKETDKATIDVEAQDDGVMGKILV
jgi:hypothetical protein